MDTEKKLLEIGLDLDVLQAHVNRLHKKGSKLHLLDIELLQNNTRKLYEKLVELELGHGKQKPAEKVRSINLPETTPKAEIPEKSEETKGIKAEVVWPEPNKEVEQEPAIEPPKKEAPPVRTAEKPISRPEPPPLAKATPKQVNDLVEKPKEKVIEKTHEPETIEKTPEPETRQKPVRSAIDLFSSNAEESIGDKLGSSDESSVAARMRRQKIGDLKQAIGINEKFLFINELFNGDLGKYNKAIDELNNLPSAEGVKSYLIELKVAGQWSNDNEAYLKLKNLLDRKWA